MLHENQLAEVQATDEEYALAAKWMGEAQWLNQTTHPILATACSMYSSYINSRVGGIEVAMKHFWKFIKGVQNKGLMKKNGNREGLKISTDSDLAGLYTITGQTKSRSGLLCEYDGMAFCWKSSFQKVVHKCDGS